MQTPSKTASFFQAAAMLLTAGSLALGLPEAQAARAVAASAENRPVDAGITGVILNGAIRLKLQQGATPSLTIHGEHRLLPQIATVRDGDALRIETRGSFYHSEPVIVTMTLPGLRQLTVMGSGDSEVTGFSGQQLTLGMTGSGNLIFNGQYDKVAADLRGSGSLRLNAGNSERIELNLFGSGDITASGKTREVTAKLAGSGDLDARQLQAESATVSVFGTGDASVHALRTVAVSSRGTGDVDVYGKPAQRAVSTSGTGSVRWQ